MSKTIESLSRHCRTRLCHQYELPLNTRRTLTAATVYNERGRRLGGLRGAAMDWLKVSAGASFALWVVCRLIGFTAAGRQAQNLGTITAIFEVLTVILLISLVRRWLTRRREAANQATLDSETD